jgi:hypothetical protein
MRRHAAMILPLVPLEVPFKAGLTKDSITKLYNSLVILSLVKPALKGTSKGTKNHDCMSSHYKV